MQVADTFLLGAYRKVTKGQADTKTSKQSQINIEWAYYKLTFFLPLFAPGAPSADHDVRVEYFGSCCLQQTMSV